MLLLHRFLLCAAFSDEHALLRRCPQKNSTSLLGFLLLIFRNCNSSDCGGTPLTVRNFGGFVSYVRRGFTRRCGVFSLSERLPRPGCRQMVGAMPSRFSLVLLCCGQDFLDVALPRPC
ncbi:unnamed protein product [Ectocarpus sp. 8 AP-2014]